MPGHVHVSVGNFGGYDGRALHTMPTRNGLLTIAHEGRPSALQLLWSFSSSPAFTLGEARSPDGGGDIDVRLRGWITFEMLEPRVRALVSRAWPAVRLEHQSSTMRWLTTGSEVMGVVDGVPQRLELPLRRPVSEPWLIVFNHEGPEDTAVLLTFTNRLTGLTRVWGGYELRFATGGGALHVMPLEGIRRRPRGDVPLDHWIASARAWVTPLLAFPVGCDESSEIVGDYVLIRDRFVFETLRDAYGNEAQPLAPLPPAVALAADRGYPVALPGSVVRSSTQLNVPTLFGPFQFVRGAGYGYFVPTAFGRAVSPERSRAPVDQPIRDELLRIIDGIGDPTPDFVDNNLGVVAFLGDAASELDPDRRRRARAFAERAFAGALTTLYETTEPLSRQRWATLGSTWRSHFAKNDPPWAKDKERFDSEYYNGQALSALAASMRLDPSFAAQYFDRAEALYAYDQIFVDWATGSVLTQATGETSNIDGVEFAWAGMLAMERLARAVGAEELRRDAVYRAARQQLALFAMWQQASWMKEWDHAVGHVTGGRIAAANVDPTGPIDSYTEEFGAALLEWRSFWQCTGFVFYGNRPLFDFYERYGLVDRIRVLEYETMPRFHPAWMNGNAIDAHAENGQPSYGTAWTAAHLLARARLFGDDPQSLFAAYTATKSTAAAATWYRMQLPGIAGPLMLFLLERAAHPLPPVIFPATARCPT